MATLLSARAQRRALPYTFVIPITVLLVLVNFYPIVYSLYLSLSTWGVDNFLAGPQFAGLVNYQALLTANRLWGSVGFMVFYIASSLSLEFVLGTAIALLLDSYLPARGLVRSAVILPLGMAPLIVAYIWRYLFDADFGWVNYFLGLVRIEPIVWLSTLPWARIAIVLVDVWNATPFVAVVLLAGLQAIPDEYWEAARIDGSGVWQVFWSITFPLLRPALLVAIVVRLTDAVRMFDLSYAVTNGGPYASTETLSYYAFTVAFQQFNLPLAAAVSWFIFAVNLTITLVCIRLLYVKVEV